MPEIFKDTFLSFVADIQGQTPDVTILSPDRNSRDSELNDVGARKSGVNYENNEEKISKIALQPPAYNTGSQSLMNEHAILTVGNAGKNYKDNMGASNLWHGDEFKYLSPTAKNIIENYNKIYEFAPYKLEDFLYSKFYGIVPNTHLITLRRFYRPVFDNMQVHIQPGEEDFTVGEGANRKKLHYPIATAVTWFGNETENNLQDLLSFSYGMNWSDLEAQVEKPESGSVDYSGSGSGKGKIGNAMSKAFRAAAIGTGSNQVSTGGLQEKLNNYDPYEDGPYKNKVFGPINVIDKTKKRERGLTFEQSFTINFQYTLRSLNSNNPKVVMLDILSNFLSLSFNFAQFWGGANRFFPGSLSNSPIPGGWGAMSKLYGGDPAGAAQAIKASLSKTASGISKSISDVVSSLGDVFSGKAGLGDVLSKFMGSSGGKNIMDVLLKSMGVGDINAQMSIPPLLTGDPVGEWHLQVGNPFNPTLMVGNMIIDNVEVSFNNDLSFEGFPTEMTFSVSLKHGRPRDSADIQSMFNRGNGRTYHYYDDSINDSSATRNTNNDNSGYNDTSNARKFSLDEKQGDILRGK